MRITYLQIRRKGNSPLQTEKILNDTVRDALASGYSVCRIFDRVTDKRGRVRRKLKEVIVR